MKLAKTFTQHNKHCQSCYQILRNGKTHTSSQRLLSYYVKGSIKYPEKSLYVKKHPYDRETHKKYAAAMAHLKAKKRKGVGVFVENTNMITDLVKQGLSPSYIFYVKDTVFDKLPISQQSTKAVQITEKQMAKLSDVATSQGVMAVFDRPSTISTYQGKSIPLIVYLDQIGNPGNLGTIIRSAAGASCTSVVTSPNSADFWLPATIRAAAASHFLIPLHEKLSFEELLETLPAEWNICFVESTSKNSPQKHPNSIPYYEADFTQPTVMVFGKEAGGLSHATRVKAVQHGRHRIINTYIPTIAELDSLNVAMAATVLIYEMAKQQSKLSKIDNSSVIKSLSSIPSNSTKDECETTFSHDVNDLANKLEAMFPAHLETGETADDYT